MISFSGIKPKTSSTLTANLATRISVSLTTKNTIENMATSIGRRQKYEGIKIKTELKARLLDFLSDKSCTACGISDPRVLDFDHINIEEKSFGIARGLTNAFNWVKILTEIEKYQILCANCHRIRTAEQFNWYRK